MSLINDALKRASQSQKERAAAPPPAEDSATPPLQPVDYSQAQPTGSPSWLVPVVAAVILVCAAGALWKWWQSGQSTPTTAASAMTSSHTSEPSEPGLAATRGHLNPPAEIQVNTNPVARPAPPVERTATTPAATPAAPPVTASVPTVTPASTPSAPAAAAAVPPTNTTVTVTETPAPKPAFPEMKLQGIFYRLRRPSVMINNQTLYKGDEVEGAKVVDIERQSVTVEFNGEKRVLTIR